MKKTLLKEKCLHTDKNSLVEIKINDKTWWNLSRDFDGKNTFKGKTSVFTDIDKAIKAWKKEK